MCVVISRNSCVVDEEVNAFRFFASPLLRQTLHVIFVADVSMDALRSSFDLTAGLSDAIVLVIVRLVGLRSVLRASFEDGLVRSLSIVSSVRQGANNGRLSLLARHNGERNHDVEAPGCSLDSEARVVVLHH